MNPSLSCASSTGQNKLHEIVFHLVGTSLEHEKENSVSDGDHARFVILPALGSYVGFIPLASSALSFSLVCVLTALIVRPLLTACQQRKCHKFIVQAFSQIYDTPSRCVGAVKTTIGFGQSAYIIYLSQVSLYVILSNLYVYIYIYIYIYIYTLWY